MPDIEYHNLSGIKFGLPRHFIHGAESLLPHAEPCKSARTENGALGLYVVDGNRRHGLLAPDLAEDPGQVYPALLLNPLIVAGLRDLVYATKNIAQRHATSRLSHYRDFCESTRERSIPCEPYPFRRDWNRTVPSSNYTKATRPARLSDTACHKRPPPSATSLD